MPLVVYDRDDFYERFCGENFQREPKKVTQKRTVGSYVRNFEDAAAGLLECIGDFCHKLIITVI